MKMNLFKIEMMKEICYENIFFLNNYFDFLHIVFI